MVAVDGGGRVVTGVGTVVDVTTCAGSFAVHAAASSPMRASVAMTLTIGERIRLGESGPCSCVTGIRTPGQDLRKNGRGGDASPGIGTLKADPRSAVRRPPPVLHAMSDAPGRLTCHNHMSEQTTVRT